MMMRNLETMWKAVRMIAPVPWLLILLAALCSLATLAEPGNAKEENPGAYYAEQLLQGHAETPETAARFALVRKGCGVIPAGYLKAFLDAGGGLNLETLYPGYSPENTTGLTVGNTIWLYRSAEEATFVHEFGHFVAKYCCAGPYLAQLYSDESGSTAGVLRPYARSDAGEYFADFWANWLLYPDKRSVLESRCPKTADFVQRVIRWNGDVDGEFAYQHFDTPFRDVAPGDWCFEAVTWMVNTRLMEGVGGGYFAPQGTVSRAEIAALLQNLSTGRMGESYPLPRDVSPGDWYADAARWALWSGVLPGVSRDSFSGNGTVRRAEIGQALYSLWRQKRGSAGGVNGAVLNAYADADAVPAAYRDAMAWCVAHGVMAGDGAYLNPNGTMTRAELAAVIRNWQLAR